MKDNVQRYIVLTMINKSYSMPVSVLQVTELFNLPTIQLGVSTLSTKIVYPLQPSQHILKRLP
jgi:hypothetical protein